MIDGTNSCFYNWFRKTVQWKIQDHDDRWNVHVTLSTFIFISSGVNLRNRPALNDKVVLKLWS